MLMIEAGGSYIVNASDSGHIVVILRTVHPLTGELSDCLGFRLSPHNAFLLSERLRREAVDVSAPNNPGAGQAIILNWRG